MVYEGESAHNSIEMPIFFSKFVLNSVILSICLFRALVNSFTFYKNNNNNNNDNNYKYCMDSIFIKVASRQRNETSTRIAQQ